MNIRELKTLLKENAIHFCSYWGKKRLIAIANEQDLLPKTVLEKEKVRMLSMIDKKPSSRTREKLV